MKKTLQITSKKKREQDDDSVDSILSDIGEFGSYQRLIYALICIASILPGLNSLLSVFITPNMDHRCKIPQFSNDSYSWNKDYINLTKEYVFWTEKDGEVTFDSCTLLKIPGNLTGGNITCSNYVYDNSVFQKTATNMMNLVCDRENLLTISKSCFMVGQLLGALLSGQLSDLIGRRITFLVSTILSVVVGALVAVSSNVIVFCFLRLLSGITCTGVFTSAFVLGLELVGESQRVNAAMIIEIFFALSYLLMTMVFYFVRDWTIAPLILNIPFILTISYFWIVPESVRWLLNKGRIEESRTVLRKCARFNRKEDKLSEDKLQSLDKYNAPENFTILVVMKSPVMRKRAINCFFNWFVNTMVYYGLSLNSGNLGGNVFVNFSLSGGVEMLSYILTIPAVRYLGRRTVLCTSMVIGGLACISTIFVTLYGDTEKFLTHNWILVVLSLIGKMFISSSFATIYVFTAEIFPTPVRNASVGFSSMFARVGGIVSPFIADLGKYIKAPIGKALPLLIFGILSVIAGGFAMALPETKGKCLPQTLQDGENFGREKNTTAKL